MIGYTNTQHTIYSETTLSYVLEFNNLFYVVSHCHTSLLHGYRSLYEAMNVQHNQRLQAEQDLKQADINTVVNMNDCQVFPVVRV